MTAPPHAPRGPETSPMAEPAAQDRPLPRSDAGGTTRLGRPHQRSRGRELALQLLYSYEINKYVDDGLLIPDESREGIDPPIQGFATTLFTGFASHRTEVDAAIDARLERWSIQRLAVVDRALLRLGAFELLHHADTPTKVIINEYIELAKIYGSEAKTAKLVNGVLDRIAHQLRGADGPIPPLPPV